MNRLFTQFICYVLLAGISPAFANPLVSFPEGDFACSVEVSPHNIPKPDPERPENRYLPVLKNIAITRVGNIRRDISTWSDNSSSELWSLIDKKVSLWECNAAGKDVYVLRGGLRQVANPALLRFTEDSVSWITDKSLVKKTSDEGKSQHYQAKIVFEPKEPGVPAETLTYQAWIDAKTLLPLKFDDEQALYTLKFSGAPSSPLVMPAKIQAEYDRWLKTSTIRPHR